MPAVEKFLNQHFKTILIAFGALTVGSAVWGVVRYNNAKTATEAAELATAAKTVEDCDVVVQRYPNSVASGNALLMKADLLWKQNKRDSSVAVLRDLVSKQKDHPLYQQALMALASRLESMGEKAEARTLYERLLSEAPEGELAPLAQLRLGDMLWAEGKEDEAKKIYESLPSKYPSTNQPFFDQTQSRLEWLASALPTKEVDGPPAPKPAPAPGAKPAPGAPQIKLESSGATSVPFSIQGPTGSAPIMVTPAPAAQTKPAPSAPKPAASTPPAAATPPVKAPAPAPAPAANPPPAPAPATASPPIIPPAPAAPAAAKPAPPAADGKK